MICYFFTGSPLGPGTRFEKPRPAYSNTWVWFKHGNINLLWYTERLLIHKAFAALFSREIPHTTQSPPPPPPNTFIKNRPGLNKSTVDCDIGQWSPKGRDTLSVQNKLADPVLAELSLWQLHLLTKPAVCTAAAQTQDEVTDCASMTEPGLVCMRTSSVWCGCGPIIHSLIANS